MVRWADQRVAFGRPIRDFGQIQRHIADSYAQWRAARAYVYDVARRMSLDRAGNRVDSDGVKLVAGTMAKEVADRAIQVLGAYGYWRTGVVERLWRDCQDGRDRRRHARGAPEEHHPRPDPRRRPAAALTRCVTTT